MSEENPKPASTSPKSPADKPRILCVDDEPHILAGLSTVLRRKFDVVTAEGGEAGLEAILRQGPFMVVMSDFAMPGMNGARFLSESRVMAPEAVRVLLTGHASFESAIAAVNDGSIFRLLTKPCPPDRLIHALEDAVEQGRMITAEREYLEKRLETMAWHLRRAERLACLGTLAGAVGHELNNILSVLTHSIEFVRNGAAAGKIASEDHLKLLDHVKEHLTNHAQNLLQLVRPDKAGTPTSDLRAVINDVVNMLRTTGLLRAVELELRVPLHEVKIPVSRGEMEQVLINLLKNAIDAMEEARVPSPRIVLSVDVSEADRKVTCSVRDNGGGIPLANLPFIFEPYFTTKPASQGTGLGLFIIKQIIEQSGGKVTVASGDGAGTCFTLETPLVVAQVRSAAVLQMLPSAPLASP